MLPTQSAIEAKLLTRIQVKSIFENVLKNFGPVSIEDLERKTCSVAKISPEEFQAIVADNKELIQKYVIEELTNKLAIAANVKRKAETDADLGLKVLERTDAAWKPKQDIEHSGEVIARVVVDV